MKKKSTVSKVPSRSGKASPPGRSVEETESDVPLARARKVLAVTLEATRPLTALEIAKRCELDPSSSHRLVQNLAACGYLVRDEASKRYLPHPGMLFPLPIYHPWELVRRDAVAVVLALRDRLSTTTGLVIFYLGSRVLLELAPGRDPLTPDYRTVLTSPLHASGSGKVYLMAKTEQERREELGPEPLHRYTPATITEHSELNADLEISRTRGFVTACDDYMSGFRVVAAPVSVGGTIIGCLFCSGSSANLSDTKVIEVGQDMRNAANLFSKATPNLRLLGELLGVV